MSSPRPVPHLGPRLHSELKTIEKMLELYCKAHNAPATSLCDSCGDLLQYASKRLQSCRFQEKKPTCGNCPIHCYKPGMREKIQEVMRFAGPKMIFHHPLLAIRHMFDSLRKVPPKKIQSKPLETSSHED